MYGTVTMNLPKEDITLPWAGHMTLDDKDGTLRVRDYHVYAVLLSLWKRLMNRTMRRYLKRKHDSEGTYRAMGFKKYIYIAIDISDVYQTTSPLTGCLTSFNLTSLTKNTKIRAPTLIQVAVRHNIFCVYA